MLEDLSQESTVTVNTNDPQSTFDIAVWIGVGKTWVENGMPPALEDARNRARRIPQHIQSMWIPSRSATVASLLDSISTSPALPTPSVKFSFDPPNTLLDEKIPTSVPFPEEFRALPSPAEIRQLRLSFNNEWLAGAKSIVLAPYPAIRFPLWIEHLLDKLVTADSLGLRWLNALSWLGDCTRRPSSIMRELGWKCQERLEQLPCNELVHGQVGESSLHTRDLTLLLGPHWLDDEVLNAGCDWVRQQSLGLPLADSCLILGSHFLTHISQRLANHDIPFHLRKRSVLEQRIAAGSIRSIFIPINIQNRHWTLMKVDCAQSTLAYGDSLSMQATIPPETRSLIICWLADLLPQATFTDAHLAVPQQKDGNSCGVIVMTEITRHCLGLPAFTPKEPGSVRMEWFLRLTAYYEDESGDGDDEGEEEEGRFDVDGVSICEDLDGMELDSNSHVVPHDAPKEPMQGNRPKLPAQITPRPLFRSPSPPLTEFNQLEQLSSESETDRHHGTPPKRRKVLSSTVKGQKKWKYQRERAAAAQSGTLDVAEEARRRFQEKVLGVDPAAEVKANGLGVRCGPCGTWITLRAPHEIRRFLEHRKTQLCQKSCNSGQIAASLSRFGFRKVSKTLSTPTLSLVSVPCPGLTRSAYPKIDQYLSRTAMPGGGARSRLRLSFFIFGRSWGELTPKERKVVLRRVALEYKWINSHAAGSVHSKDCGGSVQQPENDSGKYDPPPCPSCHILLRNHQFQSAINRKRPNDVKLKFVPITYRCPVLGDIYAKHMGVRELIEADTAGSPWLRFSRGVLEGRYTGSETFLGLVKAFVAKAERKAHRKSLRGMKYDDGFDKVCSIMALVSPRAYKTFQHNFGGRSLRSMRIQRAKAPKFEHGISRKNIQTVAKILDHLNYHGPTALACDDTELEKALHAYPLSSPKTVFVGGSSKRSRAKTGSQSPLVPADIDGEALESDLESEIWRIIGNEGAPIDVEVEKVPELLARNDIAKADKLRFWILSIPLPGVPPMVVAALARGSNEDVDALTTLSNTLLDILSECGIHPVSVAHDGMEVERGVQRSLVQDLSFRLFSIKSPEGWPKLDIKIFLRQDQWPITIPQDCEHGRKTGRNQLFTGARVLALGNFPLHFGQVASIVDHPSSPLFRRDVFRVDKQDDRAAERMTSSRTLEHICKHNPDHLGLILYLFNLGEMIDAWQSRTLSHQDRARMVIRSRYFLLAWTAHIDAHPDYTRRVQLISRESLDIFTNGICDSLIALIITYREYYPTYPLLPWLHSTAAVEHTFGVIRRIKRDVTIGEVLHLMPKITCLLQAEFADLSSQEQANQTAAGYHHTYFKAQGVDVPNLMVWPTDEDFAHTAKLAATEVQTMMKFLGIDITSLFDNSNSTPSTSPKPKCPDGNPVPPDNSIGDQLGDPPVADADAQAASHGAKQEEVSFRDILRTRDSLPILTSKEDDELDGVALGIVAAEAEILQNIDSLEEPSESTWSQVRNAISSAVGVSAKKVLPAMSSALRPLPLTASDGTLDLVSLVHCRAAHETQSAKRACRQLNQKALSSLSGSGLLHSKTPDLGEKEVTAEDVKKQLSRRLHHLLSMSYQGSTSGVARQVRHTGTPISIEGTTMREANRAVMESSKSDAFFRLRKRFWTPFVKIHRSVAFANVSGLTEALKLRPGVFVIALHQGRVVLGEVVTFYKKTSNTHEYAECVDTIGHLSYIAIRMFSPTRPIPPARSSGLSESPPVNSPPFSSISCPSLGSSTFLQIPATHFLLSLAGFEVQKAVLGLEILVNLSPPAARIFYSWVYQQESVAEAVKKFVKELSKSRKK